MVLSPLETHPRYLNIFYKKKIIPMWLTYMENKQQQRLERKNCFPDPLTSSVATGLIFPLWKYDLEEEESFTCLL